MLLYTDNYKKLNHKQKKEIKEGYDSGFPIPYLESCCLPEYNWKQLHQIVMGYWISKEGRSLYMKPEKTADQMREIRKGLEHHLSLDQISMFKDGYDWRQMEQIRLGLESKYSMEQIALFADKDRNWMQMLIIRKALDNDFTPVMIQLMNDKQFHWLQMMEIFLALREGLTLAETAEFAVPSCPWWKMHLYRLELEQMKHISAQGLFFRKVADLIIEDAY